MSEATPAKNEPVRRIRDFEPVFNLTMRLVEDYHLIEQRKLTQKELDQYLDWPMYQPLNRAVRQIKWKILSAEDPLLRITDVE